ncbi:MAG: ribosome biogenesis GTP-binding protein YihA/YsxC [Candidatus Cloacimonetes bacterium]|nr:ribosome biogenesis GTP-binding protein YihA/YsxC [Candidatus Cloacimonadota bacterium]
MIRIVKSEFLSSAVTAEQYPASSFTEFAFVGRSNVGKSSLLNTLLNRKSLAKVSGQPGKTRLVNFFQVQFKSGEEDGYFSLVDLPGYGFAKVSKTERDKWKVMINEYFSSRLQLQGVFVLVDIRHKADPKDIDVIRMLAETGKTCCVIATKSDKIPLSKQAASLNGLKIGLGLRTEEIFAFSSLKKKGIPEILKWIEKIVI